MITEELESLENQLKKPGRNLSPAEFKRLYELAGIKLSHDYGVILHHNPCSVASITETVLKMTSSLEPCRMLNVGLGGYPLADLALSKKGFEITGVEYAHSLASLAKQVSQAAGISFPIAVADGIALPFKNNSFDACLCSETLEHIPDDRKVLAEIHRILRPGGFLILTVPNYWSLCGSLVRFRHFLKTKSWILHPNHLREYHYFGVRKLTGDLFKIKKHFPVPFTSVAWRQMPYERFLGALINLPGLRLLSVSVAFLLQKNDA